MRRALILILTLTLLCFGSGVYLDHLRQETAQGHLKELEALRQLVLDGRWDDAAQQERLLTAHWQKDARWLKCLISHQHTREVDAALLRLSTGISQRWMEESLPALDEAHEALREVYDGHMPVLENVV